MYRQSGQERTWYQELSKRKQKPSYYVCVCQTINQGVDYGETSVLYYMCMSLELTICAWHAGRLSLLSALLGCLLFSV